MGDYLSYECSSYRFIILCGFELLYIVGVAYVCMLS